MPKCVLVAAASCTRVNSGKVVCHLKSSNILPFIFDEEGFPFSSKQERLCNN